MTSPGCVDNMNKINYLRLTEGKFTSSDNSNFIYQTQYKS